MSSNIFMQRPLIIGEYSPKILYIPGPKSIVTDALSRLLIMDKILDENIYHHMYRKSTHIQKT